MINAQAAMDKLNEYLAKGRANAERVLEQVASVVPKDQVVPGTLMGFSGGELPVSVSYPGAPQGALVLHRNALHQAADRLGVPRAYVDDLNMTAWGRQLLAENFAANMRDRRADNNDELLRDKRYLVRSVGSQARGFLSNRFRRLDSRPILDGVLGVANDVGAVVASGYAGETKVSLRIVLPTVRETLPGSGDYVIVGVDFSNSDFGNGALDLSSFILRLVCINGAMVATDFRKVHLGSRLSENVEYSERTYTLDTKATVSAVSDTTRFLLSAGRIDAMTEALRKAAGTEIDPKAALASIRKRITKAESEAIVAKFNSPDVVDLPAGQTSWRFSNAVSWLARETQDGERRLDLESLAGEFIPTTKAA
jgi:hypothetical protein